MALNNPPPFEKNELRGVPVIFWEKKIFSENIWFNGVFHAGFENNIHFSFKAKNDYKKADTILEIQPVFYEYATSHGKIHFFQQ